MVSNILGLSMKWTALISVLWICFVLLFFTQHNISRHYSSVRKGNFLLLQHSIRANFHSFLFFYYFHLVVLFTSVSFAKSKKFQAPQVFIDVCEVGWFESPHHPHLSCCPPRDTKSSAGRREDEFWEACEHQWRDVVWREGDTLQTENRG